MIKLLNCCVFSLIILSSLCAQDYAPPPRITKWKEYKEECRKDSSNTMIELRQIMPDLLYDLRYATLNNFMHRYMYDPGTHNTYLRKEAATALKKVQEDLGKQGYGLKIFDAYRPYSVTQQFWELVKDERYVANPAKGSGHNRGIAVDLTIIRLKTGEELNMGTGFDNFTDSAHQSFRQLPDSILKNRELLKGLMEKAGFKALETEWWHYSLPKPERFMILDLPFRKLRKSL